MDWGCGRGGDREAAAEKDSSVELNSLIAMFSEAL